MKLKLFSPALFQMRAVPRVCFQNPPGKCRPVLMDTSLRRDRRMFQHSPSALLQGPSYFLFSFFQFSCPKGEEKNGKTGTKLIRLLENHLIFVTGLFLGFRNQQACVWFPSVSLSHVSIILPASCMPWCPW